MNVRRFKHRSKRRSKRHPINVLASLMTTMSLYMGISSIFASFAGEFSTAALFILIAIVFDMLDGFVARLTRSVSEFGKELDSLCDAVSFGVAPAVLIYIGYLKESGAAADVVDPVGSTVAIVFAICAVLRLARFNVYQSTQREYFTGLPSPAAGGTVAAFVLFTQYFELQVAFWVLTPLTLLLSYLMVSNVRYPKDKLKSFILAPRSAFRFLALFVIGIAVIHYARLYSPAILLFPLASAYVILGVVETLYYRSTRRLTREGLPQPAGEESDAGGAASLDDEGPSE